MPGGFLGGGLAGLVDPKVKKAIKAIGGASFRLPIAKVDNDRSLIF